MLKKGIIILLWAAVQAAVWAAGAGEPNEGYPMPMYSLTKYADKIVDPNDPHALESYPAATFGAGCYWGVEHACRDVPGVLATAVGFMGGRVKNPTYERVCRGDTGHAESVQLRYDPNQVSYGQLLTVFFEIHNPTLKNRQGNDIGTQYRSVIFFHTPEQKKEALLARAALDKSGKYRRPIATEITAAREFWPAEEYHQRYLEKNPGGYCHIQFPVPVIEDMKEEKK